MEYRAGRSFPANDSSGYRRFFDSIPRAFARIELRYSQLSVDQLENIWTPLLTSMHTFANEKMSLAGVGRASSDSNISGASQNGEPLCLCSEKFLSVSRDSTSLEQSRHAELSSFSRMLSYTDVQYR